jgi:hypothetical protein
MSTSASFLERLEAKVDQQLRSQRVGYLLGAGASYLDGKGYPLSSKLWEQIAAKIRSPERDEIQAKFDSGADGIEQALDLLDDGAAVEKSHRYLVTEAIAEKFLSISPPTEFHQVFVSRLGERQELNIPVFSLNYDDLIEIAADTARVRLIDGFMGVDAPFFEPQTFQELYALPHRGPRKPQADWRKGVIHLYKLHGSLGWFEIAPNNVRRLGLHVSTPSGAKRVMVPPQRRKASDTTAPPYAALWSNFRGFMCHGPSMLNRLVVVGYGLRDEHVNAIIENALARSNFTLLVFAYSLTSTVFARWSGKKNTIIVTADQSALNGEVGPGHPGLWKFEELTRRV